MEEFLPQKTGSREESCYGFCLKWMQWEKKSISYGESLCTCVYVCVCHCVYVLYVHTFGWKLIALDEQTFILFLGLWSLIQTHALNGEYYHRMAGTGFIVYCTVCAVFEYFVCVGFSSRWVKFSHFVFFKH